MTECLNFCILLDPGMQTFTPVYFAVVSVIAAALIGSVFASPKRIKAGFHVNRKAQLCLVVAMQIAVLSSFQAKNAQVVASGRILKLSANPSDPVDLFRGNYQALLYPDSSLDGKNVTFHNLDSAQKGAVVYVSFKDGGAFWKASDVYTQNPPPAQDRIVMKARVDIKSVNHLALHYGIEQFYFEEGKQLNLGQGATAYVHVNENGDAVLTELIPLEKSKLQDASMVVQ